MVEDIISIPWFKYFQSQQLLCQQQNSENIKNININNFLGSILKYTKTEKNHWLHVFDKIKNLD